MGKPIIWSGANAKLINSGDLVDKYNNSLTDGGKVTYTWPSHGLTSADIGRPVRIVSANQLAFAQADTAANAEVAGFIYAIIDIDTVRVSMSGYCPAVGANAIVGGTPSASTIYFLDDATAGKLTAAEPTNIGSISKPLAVGTSLSSLIFINYRGSTIGSTNARTQINLSNNSTTNMQNCASYDAGSIEGWIYIDATTDYRFYFNAPFAEKGTNNDYFISPSYVGDTPPAGFSITINSSGQSIITLPNISGFVSATCTYSLNAPAVGTNFPLAIDGSQITGGTIGASYLPLATSTTRGAVSIYDAGTWTPTIAAAGTNFTSVTYSSYRYGFYTRIGNLVTCSFIVQWTNTSGTPTLGLIISGLPFTSATNVYSTGSCEYSNVNTPSAATPQVIISIVSASSVIAVNAVGTGTVAVNCTAAANSGAASRYIQGCISYQV